jgi:hypothetical protein
MLTKGEYMGFGSGGSGGGSIASSNDVALNNPTSTEVLSYDATTSKWKNAATVTAAQLAAKQDVSAKGAVNGYASLDSTSLVPRTQLGTGTADSASVLHGDGTWSAVVANAPVQSVAGKTGTVTLSKADVGLENVDNTTDAAKPVSTATATALSAKQDVSAKGQASGYASLDSTSLVPRTQLGTGTASSASVLHGDGTWSTVAAAPVQSVAGRTGVVTLAKGDVGLGNVDNTADTAKPISTATQTALNTKAATAHAHATTDITSGVFDATRLPVSSDTAVGVVELATAAETAAGTDGTRAVTPLGLKTAMAAATPATVLFVNTLNDVPAGTPVDTLVVVRAA